MADIIVSDLNKSFGEHEVLKDVNIEIFPGEKVGLIGRNGAGKTTLFKILCGRLDYDSGVVATGADKSVGMIDQMPDFPAGSTVEDVLRSAFSRLDRIRAEMAELEQKMALFPAKEYLSRYGALSNELENAGGYTVDFMVDKVANGLGIDSAMRQKQFSVLSGGEKTRVNLARIILEDTDILLLDEPTNHLDMKAMDWLGVYLAKYKGTVVVISHDRYFLDEVVDRIVELEDGRATSYPGSYSAYAVEKERRLEQQQKDYENYMAEKKRLEQAAELLYARGTQSEKLMKRSFAIEKRIERMKAVDRPKKERALDMAFTRRDYGTEDVLRVRSLTKRYGERTLFEDLSFEVKNGEHVAIIGENGTGKTTLLSILLGTVRADSGVIKKGPGLKPGYLPQLVTFSHPERNLVDTLIYEKNMTAQTARNRLGSFRFSGEEQLKCVSTLSGGEKSRLRLCLLMYDEINMLILDEPTNHLDIASREWIEEAIETFDGTMLFVSHDRYFVSRFADRILEFENGKITDFKGTLDEYRAYQARQSAPKAPEPKKETAKASGGETPRRARSNSQKLERKLSAAEREIERAEGRMQELDADMAAAATDHERLEALCAEKAALEAEIEKLYAAWEELSEQMG